MLIPTKTRTVFIFDKPIKQHTRHSDGATGEVGIVIQAIQKFHTRRRVNIASEKGKDVIL